MAMIVAVIGTPFALACEALICNILAADTIEVKPGQSVSKSRSGIFPVDQATKSDQLGGVHRTMILLRRAEEALGCTAEDDFRTLSRELHLYRNSLSIVDKKDFDSELSNGFLNELTACSVAIWGLNAGDIKTTGVMSMLRSCGDAIKSAFKSKKGFLHHHSKINDFLVL